MQRPNIPIVDLVFVGGGHSHAIALKMLAMNPMAGVRVTLISESVDTPYSGMLPGLLAGHFDFDECHIDLRRLSEAAGISFIQTRVTSLDLKSRKIYCANRAPIHYDVLSINTGSTPDLSVLSSGNEQVIPVKPIANFLSKITELEKKTCDDLAIVGGGAAGVELALSLDYRFNTQQSKNVKITLINADNDILKQHHKNVRKKVNRILKHRNIEVHNKSRASYIEIEANGKKRLNFVKNDKQELKQGQQWKNFDEIIWATHASAPGWLQSSGLELDKSGFIVINNFLQSNNTDNVFATGDIATILDCPRPKSGVFAVRQGMPLYENIKRYLLRLKLKAYYPQKHFLSLLNCGNEYAVASWRSIAFSGHWLWKVKRWIDKSFMLKFEQLEVMETSSAEYQEYRQLANDDTFQQISKIEERCGGCGAKVGASLLNRVLARIATEDNNEVVNIQKDDAAIIDIPDNTSLVQSIDYFRGFIDDPFLLGQIATIHALSDIHAMGAKAHSAQVLIGLPFMAKAQQEETLFQLMSGIVQKLKEEKVSLIGGHTNESSEIGCGLTVNGFVDKNAALSKGNLQKGQQLILTKPLGTGIILAANMKAIAKGRWLDQCLDSMLQSNAKASEIIQSYSLQSCTDITGFGLAGHLTEMLQASDCQARININHLPYFDGVKECLQQEILSSLYTENLAYDAVIDPSCKDKYQNESLYPLLFDPQTAGGLLAAVPTEKVNDILGDLHKAGYKDATIIGEVIDVNDSGSKLFLTLNT